MNRRYWLLLTLAVFLTLALAACGGKGSETAPTKGNTTPPTPATAPDPAAESKPAAAPALKPTAVPAPKPTAAPAVTPEEDSLSLESRDTGLDKLDSYRATWHADWKSTEQDKTESGNWKWTEEYTADPKARHFSMSSPDPNDAAVTTAFEMWQIGDITYMKESDEEECFSYSSDNAAKNIDKMMFRPSALGRIDGAKYVGRETVNGIATKHYTYTTKLSMAGGAGEVTGETWVATDGGYVVKDTVTWQGGSGFLGVGGSATGEGAWTWEITDVNNIAEITPPEGCEAPAVLDLPIMPDATDKVQFGSMITYKSASSVTDVAAFYKEKLVEAGWKAEGEPTEMGEIAMLNYTKDGKTLNLMITSSDGATQVVLSTGE